MALNWLWKNKLGTLTICQTYKGMEDRYFTFNLYRGNAFMIMIREFTKDGQEMYDVSNFFIDADHLKRCAKNSPSVFREWKVITIDPDYYKASELNLLIKSIRTCNPKCTIILKGEKDGKES